MPTTRYRTRTDNKSNSILLRFKQGNQFDTEASTGIKVPKGKFSSSLQRINPTDEVDYEKLKEKYEENIERNWSQVYQDIFVLSLLDGKRNGTYLEIGGDDGIDFSNKNQHFSNYFRRR